MRIYCLQRISISPKYTFKKNIILDIRLAYIWHENLKDTHTY